MYEDPSSDEPNAAVFSKDDLTIEGNGKLVVNAKFNNGISTKDNLVISGGTFEVNSEDDGIMGRDSVAIYGGTFLINAKGDGIKSTKRRRHRERDTIHKRWYVRPHRRCGWYTG